MRYADVERHCLSLPGATLSIQWGGHRVFKVGGKIFAVVGLAGRGGGGPTMSFKVGDDSFEILTRLPGIVPAPYMARNKWVQVQDWRALPARDIKAYLRRAHALIAARLPKKAQHKLGIGC